jgi:hypothetical protein
MKPVYMYFLMYREIISDEPSDFANCTYDESVSVMIGPCDTVHGIGTDEVLLAFDDAYVELPFDDRSEITFAGRRFRDWNVLTEASDGDAPLSVQAAKTLHK